MNISRAGQASGLTADTIRFYERRRVVPPPARAANGYRDYSERHVAALTFAKGLRDLDLPLDLVGSLVRLAHDGTCGDLRRAMLLSIDEAVGDSDERLAVLRRTRRDLLGLRRGLAGMTPGDTSIPGIASCTCVELVSGQRKQRGAKRSAPLTGSAARSF